MNKDLISRQDAIKEVSKYIHSVDMIIGNGTLSMAGCMDVAEEILEGLPSMESEHKWIPCSEKMPSETVIATVETKVYRYVCEAVWIPRWTWKASFYFEWEDCSEYKEEDDEYYVIEGWYERVHNWDEYEYVAIDDNVIAWMPIPTSYKGEWGDSE